MDSLRNLPIHLRYETNGDVFALCPLLRNCSCTARSRSEALRIMQKLIQARLTPNTAPEESTKYEIVYLAVTACADSEENRFSSRASRRSHRPESPLLEIL